MVGVQVLFAEVVDHVGGLRRGEQRDTGAVAEKAQVAVVGHDVHRCVPGNLRRRGGAGAYVIDCADITAAKAQAGAVVEHGFVVWVGGGQRKGES